MNTTSSRGAATAVAMTSLLLVTGCGDSGQASGSGGVSVVTGFYPLEWAASRVGGERVDVTSLTAPGAEPHDLELTAQDVATVSDADLLVYLGGFQAAVDEAAGSQAGDRAWDVAGVAVRSPTASGDDHGHGGDHGHGAGEEEHAEGEHVDDEHADGEHADEATDPHFWLDPTRLADVGDALAARLSELDPDGADTYEQNAAALREDLEALDREIAGGLTGCGVDVLVTSHDAFGYLADRYGFEVVGISGISPSAEPSADQLAQISGLVSERRVTTVYTETLVDPAVAETVASEAGVSTAVLDPLEGLTEKSAGEDYLAVMRANLATLQEGQSCP